MALANYPQLKKLPAKKKMALAEELWAEGVSDSDPVSAKHKALLDERLASYRSGKVKLVTFEELDSRLRKR